MSALGGPAPERWLNPSMRRPHIGFNMASVYSC
jgi:hypothetical protein